MELRITGVVAQGLTAGQAKMVGIEERRRYGHDYYTIGLKVRTVEEIREIRGWFSDMEKVGVRGAKTVLRDIDSWLKALVEPEVVRARTLRHFAALLTEYLRRVPGHRLYKAVSSGSNEALLCYYVNSIFYHPEQRGGRGDYQPAYVELKMMYNEFGEQHSRTVEFGDGDARQQRADMVLASLGWMVETSELREGYLATDALYTSVVYNVGEQYLANGWADGEIDNQKQSSHMRKGTYKVGTDAEPRKVVIDIFQEEEGQRSSHSSTSLDRYFWPRNAPRYMDTDKDEADEPELNETPLDISEAIFIPTHPFCALFDLQRHRRMRMHVSFLQHYEYDIALAEKLIVTEQTKSLVNTLVNYTGVGFEDIIHGKGGGVCVLLTGPPGVGKTLTAEVFAEASKRPLYSVQAAQLGIGAQALEQELTLVLQRGSRWNAVVLIDEADVYIRTRGEDLNHNAIVGAFLRVLEYQQSVLFLTTNLPERVDDAIASRCLARIDYTMPGAGEQRDIWRVLATMNNQPLSDDAIATITNKHDDLSGRDIKQLLKLAGMVGEVNPETVDFVRQFKPNVTAKGFGQTIVPPGAGTHPLEDYLTLADAAEAIGVTTVTLWRWERAGKMPVFRLGREVLIEKADVERLKVEQNGGR